MDIYILHDDQQIGPFGKDAAQALLQQGDVAADDLAWHSGVPEWLPLSELLAAEPVDSPEISSAPPEPPPAPSPEPATPGQIAFLNYFAIATPEGLTKEEAEEWITKTTADPKGVDRLALWKQERVRLHPEIFADEGPDKIEDRVQLYFDRCQEAGAKYFRGVTKAHCQVLVAFLDVKFPRWDAQPDEAVEHYIFPAIAEKFPQLIHKQWRGQLHYGRGLDSVARAMRKTPVVQPAKKSASPFGAIFRGILYGLVILAALYGLRLAVLKGKIPWPPKRAVSSLN